MKKNIAKALVEGIIESVAGIGTIAALGIVLEKLRETGKLR